MVQMFKNEVESHLINPDNRELTNRRLSHDDAVRLRDVTSAHAYMGTCQSRAKVDDVGESDLPASRK